MTSIIDAAVSAPTAPSPARAPGLSRLRRRVPARRPARLFRVFRPARGRLRPGRARAGSPGRRSRRGPKNIWRYAGLLPVGPGPGHPGHARPRADPAGRRADALGRRARASRAPLWVKDDSANPTHSFKDRVVSVALTAARGLGFTRFACASTGNLANSVAAHAARAGVPSIVFIPADLEPGKVVTTAVYGGDLVAIDGSYDDVNRLCGELVETDEFEDTAFVNVNVRPFYAEGSKTLGLRGGRAARLADPGAGGHPDGQRRAAHQDRQGVHRAGRDRPGRGAGRRLEGVRRPVRGLQPDRDGAARAAPTRSRRSSRPASPSRSTSATRPPGLYALEAVRRTGGWMDYADDDEIRDAHPAARPHHRGVRRDRRRGDRRGAAQAGRRAAGSTRPRRPSCSTPARGSRRSTRSPRSSGRRTG